MKTKIKQGKERIVVLEQEITELRKEKSAVKLDLSQRLYRHSKEFRMWKALDSKQRKLETEIEQIKYDTKAVRSLVHKLIPETSTASTTAVRGHSAWSHGKKVGNGYIDLKGVCFYHRINEVAQLLINNGYTIKSIEQPSYSLALGHRSSLRYEPIIKDEK